MTIQPADERPHAHSESGPWAERWSLVFVSSNGLAGRVATTVRDGEAAVSVLVLRREAGPIVARDLVGTRDEPFELRGDGLWVNQWCETPFEHWTYGLEAFGVELDRPHDAWTGERGTRLAVGWDLDWERTGSPFDLGAGYVQPGRVRGEILLGADTLPYDGVGLRSHLWGEVLPDGTMWWHDDEGDSFVFADRAVRWEMAADDVVSVGGYDSTVDTRGFPTRVDLTLGADDARFDINPDAWAAEIVEEHPLRVVPHTAFTVCRDGAVIGAGWESGSG